MKLLFGNTPIECSAIAFDKDGTLIDSYAFWKALYSNRVLSMNDTLDQKTILTWSVMNGVEGEGEFIASDGPLAVGTFNEEKVVLATAIYMVERRPWDEALSLAGNLMVSADQRMQLDDYLKPLPGVPDKLHELAEHNLPMCILTSDIRERTMDALNHFGLDEIIRVVVTPADVMRGKPAPDMVNKAAEALNLDPVEIAVVGDSPLDLQMANAAGATAIGVTSNSDPHQFVEVYITIESVQDISIPSS